MAIQQPIDQFEASAGQLLPNRHSSSRDVKEAPKPPRGPHTHAAVDVQHLIDQFKASIDQLLSNESPSLPDMEEVLQWLHRAERHAASRFPHRRRLAWRELLQAKLALNRRRALATCATTQISAQHDHEPAFLEHQLYGVWNQLNEMQRQQFCVNTNDTIDWLIWGKEALQKSDLRRALYCIMRARCALVYAQECARWTHWGFVVILIELLYLFLLPGAMYLYAWVNHMAVESVVVESLAAISQSTMLNIPCYVYVWGFLGGAAWCLNFATRWSKKRLFDRHYLAWYIAHPWISAVLGSAVTMIIIGGLAGISADSITSPTATAVLSLVSFVTGFSTNSMWKLLDRSVRKLLGDENPEQKKHQELHESFLKGTKQ